MRGSFRFLILAFVFFIGLAGLHAQPFAALTLRDGEICEGDSVIADILISGGVAPYTLIISNHLDELDTLENVFSPVLHWLKPEISSNIRVSRVMDANQVVGTTSLPVSLNVLAATNVNFILDRSEFFKTEGSISLASNPSGASFFGDGVLGSNFYPSVAGVQNHELGCVYTNANGCRSYDYKDVQVIHGEAGVQVKLDGVEVDQLCDYDINYDLVGSNMDGVAGLFRLRRNNSPTYLEGYIIDEDSSDNKAVLDPAGLWGNFVVEYHCDFGELHFQSESSFTLNDLDPMTIEGFPELICSADDPYLLTPGGIPVEAGASYVFSGPGISGNQEGGYYFDPGDPDVSSGSHLVRLGYTTQGGCSNDLDEVIRVNYSPEVSFGFSPSCLPLEGGEVQFANTSIGKYSVDRWEWSFGDPASGELNSSSAESPAHHYASPGNYQVELHAYTAEGCISSSINDTILPDEPVADFSWMHDCYEKGQATAFFSTSTSTYSQIDSLQWTFQTSTGLVLGVLTSSDPHEVMEFPFSSMDKYGVVLKVWDQVGCIDQVQDDISLQPTVTVPESGYLEEFDQGAGDWEAFGTQNSWELGIPDFSGYEGFATDHGWFTDFPEGGFSGVEHSGVESPCLDLGNAVRPVLSLEMMRSFRPNEDGAVLQYSRGDGEGWKTLGSVGSGGNWYNLSDIGNLPGGSASGWGLEYFNPDSDWQLASHDLSFLAGEAHLRFRIVQASAYDSDLKNQGFAFNTFRISEDLRTSLLEHFTNSSQQESKSADNVVDEYAWQNRLRVIDLQYHMDYPGDDPMNLNNPGPPSTRAFYYGVTSIPFAILNGSRDADYRFDFSSPEEEPDPDLLIQESLNSADFLLELEVNWMEESLEATVVTTCDVDSYTPNIQLYLVVKERMIRAYTGLNGDVEFRNVVLDMLPSVAGTLLGNSWVKGESKTRTFTWDYADFVEDVDDLEVVAFVTNRDQGGILQAISVPKTSTTGMNSFREADFLAVYPNPASDRVYVNTGSNKGGSIRLTDLNGRKLMDVPVEASYSLVQLDLSSLAPGVYVVSYLESGALKARSKIIKGQAQF